VVRALGYNLQLEALLRREGHVLSPFHDRPRPTPGGMSGTSRTSTGLDPSPETHVHPSAGQTPDQPVAVLEGVHYPINVKNTKSPSNCTRKGWMVKLTFRRTTNFSPARTFRITSSSLSRRHVLSYDEFEPVRASRSRMSFRCSGVQKHRYAWPFCERQSE
jgi:hypothetical protein